MNIMFGILLSIITGICLGLYFKNIALFFYIVVFLSLIFLKNRKRNLFFGTISILIFILSYGVDNKYETLFENEFQCYGIGEITSFAEEKSYTNKYIIKLKSLNNIREISGNDKAKEKDFKNIKLILYVSKDKELEYGDIIYFNANFEKASGQKNDKGFNYERYLRQSKIYGILNIENFQIIKQNRGIKYNFFRIKENLKEKLYEIFDEQEAGFLAGILLGDKAGIDDKIKEDFKKSSLSHVLAISGMHIIYITGAVEWTLGKFINSKKIRNHILIIFLILFSIFTGSSPSCLRACIMMIMIIISKHIYRKNVFFTTWCFAMSIILILNFYNIESIGMWLSFMGAFGLKKINLKNSFAVQVMIFPIIWYSYNIISLTFFISNFLISFIIGPILVIGYISLFIGKHFKIIVILEKVLLSLIFGIAEIVGGWRFSTIYVATPNISNVIQDSYLKVNFLDVGQGDCSLITSETNKSILIDGGNNKNYDYGENVVLPYLLKHGYQSLDYIMVSHFDEDHSRRIRIYN